MKPVLIALVIAVITLTTAAAQTPAPAQPAPAAVPTPAPAPVATGPTPPANYGYNANGRRDPFISLVNRGVETRPGDRSARPEGLPGLLVEEVVVRGIVQTPRGFVAMVGSPAGKTYSVRTGDRLMDGSVRAINAQTVVLLQTVNDPLSLEKQREVRKNLRGEVK